MTNQNFDSAKAQTIVFIHKSIFKDYIYKTKSEEEIEKFFIQIRDITPNECDFFEPWFRAFVAISKNDGKNSSENFLKALDFINDKNSAYSDSSYSEFLKDSLSQFLQQGFAFFMYISDTENAKKFWECGVENGFFTKDETSNFYEKFFKKFNSKEQFWVQFAPKMFIDTVKATEKATNDYSFSARTGDELTDSINSADIEKFNKSSKETDFNSKKIAGVSPLYYAIQRKGTLVAGCEKFVEELIQIQVTQTISKLNLTSIHGSFAESQYLEILHQMRTTYEKSGLAKIMFNALFGRDEEIEEKIEAIEKIIEAIVEKTTDVDLFTKDAGNKTQTNALLLAAEIGDTKTMDLLIKNGANVDKALGHADFGMKYRDGNSIKTEIPNSLIYRMISFAQYDALRFYLENFKLKARKSMTEKTTKCNITPLAYLILNTLYNARNEIDYNASKKIVDEFLPIFIDAGSKIEENTAFGSVKKLLGMN